MEHDCCTLYCTNRFVAKCRKSKAMHHCIHYILAEMKQTSSCNSALSYFFTACTCSSLAWPRRSQTCTAKWPSQVSDPSVLKRPYKVVFCPRHSRKAQELWNLGVYKPLVIVRAFPVTSANILRLPSSWQGIMILHTC